MDITIEKKREEQEKSKIEDTDTKIIMDMEEPLWRKRLEIITEQDVI